MLIRAAIEESRSWDGVSQVHLSVTEAADDARRLYERIGFREWGREPRALFWQGVYVDEAHMVLRLD
jgi:RimJ/RimL family protein N-acetyltransferase